MLILAGVTLSITLGENGIFSQSKLAVQKYENARLKEEQELQNAANEISSLGVASNRDETVTITQATYDALLKRITDLETANRNLTKQNTMSGAEHFTGEYYYNGKPIYAKTFYISSLPNTTNYSYNHNIDSIENIWCDTSKCYVIWPDGHTAPLPYVGYANDLGAKVSICINVNSSTFNIETYNNRSSLKGYITVNYTKSSDTGNSITIPATTANPTT